MTFFPVESVYIINIKVSFILLLPMPTDCLKSALVERELLELTIHDEVLGPASTKYKLVSLT